MRRIVTGHRNGKSVILDDTEMPFQFMPQGEWVIPWGTLGIPNVPLEEGEYEKHLSQMSQRAARGRVPDPGETVVIISRFLPDEEFLREARNKGIDPVEEWRKHFKDEYGMHTTNTIDYDIILSGEIWIEVDNGAEVHLKQGDCVIQNGTRHAWRNRGSAPCVMASVMVGAKRTK
jgi:mannose-6-phosphate isomerase-like protein (cupin superfamily)